MKYSLVKRILIAALTGSLCIGATLMVYAAPTGQGRGGRMGQQAGTESTENTDAGMNGERPELPEGMQKGERPELPEGMQEGERPELPEGVQEGERPELPEGINEGEKPQLPEGTQEGDGTAVSGNCAKGGRGKGGRMGRMGRPEGMVNIRAYADALEGITDEDTKASLQGYVDTLENALKAEREARKSDSGLTEEELSSYKTAVTEASDALKNAFEEAGIEVKEDTRFKENKGQRPDGVSGNRVKKDKGSASAEGEAEQSVNKDSGSAVQRKTTDKTAAEDNGTEVSQNQGAARTQRSQKAAASDDNNAWKRIKSWISDLF